LLELKEPLYDKVELQNDIDFFIKKLGITLKEYHQIMDSQPRFYYEYANSEKFINKIR